MTPAQVARTPIVLLPGQGARCDGCSDRASVFRRCRCGQTFAACGTHQHELARRAASCPCGQGRPER